MKFSNQLARFSKLSTITILAGAWSVLPAALYAAEPTESPQKPGGAQRVFACPEDAVKALQAASAANDQAALTEIFGPDFHQLLTGDHVQDANNEQRFAAAMALGCKPVAEGQDTVTLEVGTNDWPMPIPLVKANGQWRFDTAAGKEEVINRHIGKDELHAIGVCRAYVEAQRKYASTDAGQDSSYAQKFKSTPGKRDGLYWPPVENEAASPFGPLVAEAHSEGYVNPKGTGPHPFHGYYFRILSCQGKDAPGGTKNYMSQGMMSGGFALVAYPEHWEQSGIMTFIVNQDGKVYQRCLGEKTSEIASTMKEYNPEIGWTLVEDGGVAGAVAEK
jgi:hypothetical protein